MRWLVGHLLGLAQPAPRPAPALPTSATAAHFRYAHVLPSPAIEQYAGRQVRAVRFLPGFNSSPKWWEYEQRVEIDFGDPSDSQNARIAATCSSCGMCCTDIPTHQIAIYMSETELARATQAGHQVQCAGEIQVQGVRFYVLAVKPNGNCAMLGQRGCTLGDDKPLWCKIYHCEKFQDRPYLFEK